MDWRQDPKVIWRNDSHATYELAIVGPQFVARLDGEHKMAMLHPTDPADVEECISRFAAALGRTVEVLPPAPEPIKVGDRVRYGSSETGEVLAVDGDEAWVRWPRFMSRSVHVLVDLTRVTDEQPEPEPTPAVGEGWRVPVDEAEAIAASNAGANVLECVLGNGGSIGWTGDCTAEYFGKPGWTYRVPAGWTATRHPATPTWREPGDPEVLATTRRPVEVSVVDDDTGWVPQAATWSLDRWQNWLAAGHRARIQDGAS